jgi:hypothetical protein
MPFLTKNALITTVGNGALTAAALLGGFITRSGPTGAFTDTTDTAANIIAALSGLPIGTTRNVEYINTSSQTATLAGGTGVTVVANTATGVTVPTGTLAILILQVTSNAAVTITVAYRQAIS